MIIVWHVYLITLKLLPPINNVRYLKYMQNLNDFKTSAVPMEHETLKSGRDRTMTTDRRRWKDRHEG